MVRGGGLRGSDKAQQMRSGLWADRAAAVDERPDVAQYLFGRGILEQIAASPEFKGEHHARAVAQHGQDQRLAAGFGDERRDEFQTIAIGQADIDQGNIDLRAGQRGMSLGNIGGRESEFETGFLLEQPRVKFTRRRVVLQYRNANEGRRIVQRALSLSQQLA